MRNKPATTDRQNDIELEITRDNFLDAISNGLVKIRIGKTKTCAHMICPNKT